MIRDVNKNSILVVDNCYCEFVEEKSPLEIDNKADIIVGSLIKNLGGGIAPNGAYVAGRSDLVDLVAERLTVPGQGAEVGPSLGINKQIKVTGNIIVDTKGMKSKLLIMDNIFIS